MLAAVLSVLVVVACSEEPARPPAGEPVDDLVSGITPLPLGRARLDGVLPTERLLAALEDAQTDGLVRHVIPQADGSPGVILMELDLNAFEPEVVGVGYPGDNVTAADALADRGLTLVVGSGFVARYHPLTPLGLLQIDGVEVSELQRHGYTRVLGVRDGRFGVVGRREFHRGLFESAVQAGPGVVEAGRLDINERELKLPTYLRSFVATCGDRANAACASTPCSGVSSPRAGTGPWQASRSRARTCSTWAGACSTTSSRCRFRATRSST